MEIAEHMAALRREGELLAGAAERGALDTPVPTCPKWRLRDLLRHVGGVHRWATAHVREQRQQPMDAQEAAELMGRWPADAALVAWFRQGHAALVQTLELAPPDLASWTFLPAPSPLAFWARRQAHETAIHRADTESAGGPITAFPPAFAADGIDELLFGLVSRSLRRLRADPPRSLHVQATDAGREWLVRIGPERVEVRSEDGVSNSDCSVQGGASDLYLLLWNRRTPEGLAVRGDAALLDLWRQAVRIRWS